jgi:hypothetical protein
MKHLITEPTMSARFNNSVSLSPRWLIYTLVWGAMGQYHNTRIKKRLADHFMQLETIVLKKMMRSGELSKF